MLVLKLIAELPKNTTVLINLSPNIVINSPFISSLLTSLYVRLYNLFKNTIYKLIFN